MDAIVIVVGLTLLIGLSLGFCLGIFVMALLGNSEREEVPGRPPAFGHAASAWWR
jgi:hypothetical protein